MPDSKFLSFCRYTLFLLLLAPASFGQRELSGSAEIKLALHRLNAVGSVLMIAAHPDDENTAVLAYFARGRHLDTAYLSLTRGEGGQNLIGSDQGDKLGVIRTHELLAARQIDGARQFFTRAIDFGFTKTVDETVQKWGREKILGDVVWTIRRFRPDVIILRFSGTPRDGHGQHQTSAILGKEAFTVAADPTRFPEQLQWVKPWQAKRVLWNIFAFNRDQEAELQKMAGRVQIDTGDFDPLLGHSYGEIAGMSRSMHRSQGMGAAERKGSMKADFITVAGQPASKDPFDGIDTTFRRLPGGAAVATLLEQAIRDFTPEHPERSIDPLLKARPLIGAMDDPYARQKLEELDAAVAMCAGVWLDAVAERSSLVPGAPVRLTLTALARSRVPVKLESVSWAGTATGKPESISLNSNLAFNQPLVRQVSWTVDAGQPYTQPFWLQKPKDLDTYTVENKQLIGLPDNPDLLQAGFVLQIGSDGVPIKVSKSVEHRFVDRVRGELMRPLAVVPPVAVGAPETALLFADGSPKRIEISVRANGANRTGTLKLTVPAGWQVSPESQPFTLGAGEQAVSVFQVTPPSADSSGRIKAVAEVGGVQVSSGVNVIDYEHIPPQTLMPPSESKVVRAGIRTLAKHIGYVMGAGDDVPQSLRQIGCDVTLLSQEDVVRGDLSRFDAIVTGVRAWNVRNDLKANRQRFFEYVKAGGTMVVQYNVREGGFMGGDPKALEIIGPYPIQFTTDRVTVEEAPVTFPNPATPLLEYPNRITQKDFEGWVQERGLYFAGTWDSHYQPILESHDPGEKPLPGGTLFTQYGKGAYIFTGYSFFRQLPAGVPGAYRIFANFLSAGKALTGADLAQ